MRHLLFSIIAATSLTASAQSEWTLRQCIDHALSHNITIKMQEDNVRQQQIQLSTSRNQRLPSLSASAGESLSFGRALTIDNTYANRNTQSTNFGLSTDVPVFTGGQIYHDQQIKHLNLQSAMADLDKVRDDMALNVVSAYLEAVYQKDLVEVAKQQVELSKNQVHRRQVLFDNAKASEADLAQIKSALASDELALTHQQNSYSLALLTLSQLLELESPDGFDVVRPATADIGSIVLTAPDIIYSEALGIKPQVKSDEIKLKSAEHSIRMAQAGYYPTIHFSAGLSTSYYKSSGGYNNPAFGRQMKDNFSQYLSLNLSMPIFSRFQTRNSVRSARVSVHTQQLQFEQTKKTLYKDIQQAYYNALAAQKQCASSDAALESNRTSFDLVQKKYDNGKATMTEYQESKVALMKAEATAIQAKYTFLFRQKILDFYRGVSL